ncbi:MAG TPA: hypothetical protein VNX66_03330 [Candidatus Sulfotelmatobacter sp.]|nr:hypothetical protein [Candidatus Sulfotelmatobacter sp.]
MHFDSGTGLLYTGGGQVVRLSDAAILGTFGASGMAEPDSGLNRVFVLGQTTAQAGSSSFTIESFDQKDSCCDRFDCLRRSCAGGTNGLAFVTRVGGIADSFDVAPGQLYVISGVFVNRRRRRVQRRERR